MIKKFECWNCHKTFQTDDNEWVECPHCHSDNVEYYHFRPRQIIPKTILKLISLLVISIAIAIVLYKYIDWKKFLPEPNNTENQTESNENPSEQIPLCVCGCGCRESVCGCKDGEIEGEGCGCECGVCVCASGVELPPALGDFAPSFDKESETYTLKVIWVSAPRKQSITYVLTRLFEDVEIQKTSDGEFTNIPPSKDKDAGYGYRLWIKNSSTGEDICESREIFGFVPQKKVDKISANDLQKLILSGEDLTTGANMHISPSVTVVCPDDPFVQSLAQAQQALVDGLYSTIVVSTIEYDDLNCVSKVVINLK